MIGWLRRLLRRPDDPLVGIKHTANRGITLPVEDDAIQALGLELRVASDRLIDTRRRRRRRIRKLRRAILALAGGLLVLIGTGHAAQAVGVDLPIVERALRIISDSDDTTGNYPSFYEGPIDIYTPATFPSISPLPDSWSTVIRFPLGLGTLDIAGRTYLRRAGSICFLWTILNRADYAMEGVNYGKCSEVGDVLRPFSADPRLPPDPPIVTFGDSAAVVSGYVLGDVQRVTVRGPLGIHPVIMSDPWTPDPIRIPSFRTFVAARPLGERWRKLPTSRQQSARESMNYDVTAHMDDGRVIELIR